MEKKTITLSGGGVNWAWYLELETIGKTRCRIIKHWRLYNAHDYPKHPKTTGSFTIIEDAKPMKDGWRSRNAIAVKVWRNRQDGSRGTRLKVRNPGYIFGYNGSTEQPEMHGN